MKLYYTDPLKAAFMAREFGVNIIGDEGDELMLMWITSGFCWVINHKGWMDHEDVYDGLKYYIHPESLHIFKPMEGGTGINTDEDGTKCACEFIKGEWIAGKGCNDFGGGYVCFGTTEIVHRDGKAFLAPEIDND